VTPATQGPPYRDPEAPSDAVSGEAHASGCHGSPGVAERAEVDLPVSGLKPDWPRSASTWYRAGVRCPLGRARWSRSRGNGPQQANTPPSADLQNDFSSDERESACKPGVFLEAADERRTASPESVRPDADEQGDCRDQKDLQMQAFSKAADGIRTHDLLHGKQTL
jgi:hypothetical protein